MISQKIPRSSGILLHPTSLPSPYGIGDLGPSAYAWIDALTRARQSWWQILPLGPTGFGDSPYQCFSAFAGNPYLLSPEMLQRDGLIAAHEIPPASFPNNTVDYGNIIPWKLKLLGLAWSNFRSGRADHLVQEFETFAAQQSWLDDFGLFMALKDAQDQRPLSMWPEDLRRRKPSALAEARRLHEETSRMHQFGQFLFYRQWNALKNYANHRGIRIIGDAPIFVSSDSSDLWANPDLFLLDENLRPRVVAGVPPDYFAATGQLWGNPIYDWAAMKEQGYTWWAERLRVTFQQVDLVRLDHFRGFCAAWHVRAGEPTAIHGEWVSGPGEELFESLSAILGGLPLIAEDLGEITPDVHALRKKFDLPGMKVLQFGFSGNPADQFLPHNYESTTAVYTGTHDNDTTVGWYSTLPPHERHFLKRYLGRESQDISWDMLRLAWGSVANLAIAPLQDVLSLDTTARMNLPGKLGGNWQWRFVSGTLHEGIIDRLADVTEVFRRSQV